MEVAEAEDHHCTRCRLVRTLMTGAVFLLTAQEADVH